MSKKGLVIGVAAAAVGVIALRFSVDTDTWWHLAAGRWMFDHGRLLQHDVFSQTMHGRSWVNPGWLAQLILFAAYRLAGLPGLNALTAVLALGGLAFLWGTLEEPPLARAFVVVLAASAAAVFWSARPQMFTFMLAALFLWILERWRTEKSAPLWLLPVGSALWANLHGGFAVGPLLVGSYLVGTWITIHAETLLGEGASFATATGRAWRRSRRLLGVGVLTVLALAVNPNGFDLLLYPFETVSIEVLQRHIQEWQSPDIGAAQFVPFTVLLLTTMGALALSPRRKSAVELILTFGFAYLALDAARSISLFALAAAPTLSRHGHAALEPLAERFSSGPELPEHLARRLNLLLVGLSLFAAGLWSYPKLQPHANEAELEAHLPVASVEYLQRERPPGPLLNAYRWGGYVIWRLHPVYRSYVDGRTDLFGDELLEEYLRMWSVGEGWEELLHERGFGVALLERQAPLANALQAKGWRVLFEDQVSVVLAAPE